MAGGTISLSNVVKHAQIVPHVDQIEIPDIPVRRPASGEVEMSVRTPDLEEEAVQRLRQIAIEQGERERALMLQRAIVEAQEIVARAREEARASAEQVRQQAYAEGMQQGLAAAASELDSWKQAEYDKLEALAKDMQDDWQRRMMAQKHALSQFAISVVKALLGRELLLAPVAIDELVDGMLQQVIQATSVCVRVHPDDYQAACDAEPKWSLRGMGKWAVQVIPDPSMNPGDCDIWADSVHLDGRMQVRLGELTDWLAKLAEEGDARDVDSA